MNFVISFRGCGVCRNHWEFPMVFDCCRFDVFPVCINLHRFRSMLGSISVEVQIRMRNSPRELVISFRGFDGLVNHWDIPMVSGSRRFAVLHLPIYLPRFRSRLVGKCLWQISWTKWFLRFCAPVQKIVLRIRPVNVDISSRGRDGSYYHWDFPMVSDRRRVLL